MKTKVGMNSVDITWRYLLLIVGIMLIIPGVFAEDLMASFAAVPSSGPAPLNVTFVDQSEGAPTFWNWDLDGVSGWESSDQNPNYTYTSPGIYNVTLVVTNSTLASYQTSRNITVTNPVLSAQFAASPRTGYAPLNVSFIDQSIGAKSWNWTFGDNFTTPVSENSAKNPLHTYTTPGWYSVNQNVSDNYTFLDGRTVNVSLENFIHVLSPTPPEADFVATPLSGPKNLTVSFIDQTPGTENLSYIWNFGDNSLNDYTRNPIHTYTDEGSYTVSVQVTGSGGPKIVTKNNYINVNTPSNPTADFAVVPSNGVAPLNVSFIGLANGTGNIIYEWDFGDNSSHVYGRNPTHVYLTSGQYPVSLNVTDENGGTGGASKIPGVIIGEPVSPEINFTGSPISGDRPLNVSFSDFSTGLNASPVYQWWFGDNNLSYERLPTHLYNTTGIFDVCLTVISDGVSYTNVRPGFVQVTDQKATKARFAVTPRNGTAPLDVSFIDQSSGTEPLTYQWYFGDNSTADYNKNPVHQYTEPGVYSVMLRVSGPSGSDLINLTDGITVLAPSLPSSAFSAIPLSGPVPLNVSFIDQSVGTGPFTYNWSFGDGSISHDKNPVHLYDEVGNYTVNLTTTNANGYSKSIQENYICVNPSNLQALFTATPRNGTAPLDVSFIDQSVGTGPFTYNWSFGDGSISHDKNPVHLYEKAGNYSVNLTTTNRFDNSTLIQENYILVNPSGVHALFTATPRNGTAPLEVSFIDQSTCTEIKDYQWDFGDNSLISHDQNPVHIYNEPGIYNVTLGVTDGNNNSDINHQLEFIEVRTPALQKVDFAVAPSKGPVPLRVSFIDQTSGDGPFTYLWDFGDGSDPSYDKNPDHIYSSVGLYSVNLTVSGPVGTYHSIRENMINATSSTGGLTASLDFTAIPTSGNPPLQVNFVDQSYGITNVTYNWDFGDDTKSSARNPVKIYSNEGDYNVTLNVSGSNLPDISKTIQVRNLKANMTDPIITGTGPYVVNLTDNSVGYPTSWYWTIKKLGQNYLVFSSYDQNTSAIIKRAGKYSVILTTWNDRYKSTDKKTFEIS